MLNLNQRLHVRTVHVCISLCTIVAHNTAQNSCDNLPSYPPNNHHNSDDVYWRGGVPSLETVNLLDLCSYTAELLIHTSTSLPNGCLRPK